MIRPTTRADLPAQYGVLQAAIGEVFRRHRFEPPNPPPEAFEAQQGHLLDHDAERCSTAVVVVPGTSAELVAAALGAGLRIVGPPALLLLSQPAAPPRALAVSGYSLF